MTIHNLFGASVIDWLLDLWQNATAMKARMFAVTVVLFATFEPLCTSAQDTNLPHLEKRGAVTQLIVDGKPFLMLSGELYNSSSSSLEYMKPLWPKLAAI